MARFKISDEATNVLIIAERRALPSSPGTKHTQFVSIAPLTTSKSGSTAINIRARPTTWKVSMRKTKRKCEAGGFFHDLKMHIRMLRIRVPNSGTANAIMMHQIHAILSSSGNETTNCLSRPVRGNKQESDRSFIGYCAKRGNQCCSSFEINVTGSTCYILKVRLGRLRVSIFLEPNGRYNANLFSRVLSLVSFHHEARAFTAKVLHRNRVTSAIHF